MNILITLQAGKLRDQFFPRSIMEQLEQMGTVKVNEFGRTMTQDELAESLPGIDICLTHSWLGCPVFDEEVLRHAPNLKMIAHVCASVGPFLTDAVYDRGIQVCSANKIMARYVAEGTLAYMLSALRRIPQHDGAMKEGRWQPYDKRSLFGKRISLIGLGTVGRYLLELLQPFGVSVRIFDPYLTAEALQSFPRTELVATLEEAMTWGDLLSIHASRTKETYHLINRHMLSLMKDQAVLINTARGALIDEKALTAELASGRIFAVLDVFEEEPLPFSSVLRAMDNVILQPHCAGDLDYAGYTQGMVEEIRRFVAGEPLQQEIAQTQFQRMTV
ncbi:hydroxyacid dehydrogenase [Paenibacillus oryzisoli]|uniref:hydroxyacid dehydrogenase n=1 Tax=Paenibacillus oryzisoli TaxID=1850517 RepID=UPI003D266165